MAVNPLFTSESVTEGHPDKVSDQLSDSVLDAILADDPGARVACETMVSTGMVLLAGEITTTTTVDIPTIVRERIKKIGYTDPHVGFDWETCAVLTSRAPTSAKPTFAVLTSAILSSAVPGYVGPTSAVLISVVLTSALPISAVRISTVPTCVVPSYAVLTLAMQTFRAPILLVPN